MSAAHAFPAVEEEEDIGLASASSTDALPKVTPRTLPPLDLRVRRPSVLRSPTIPSADPASPLGRSRSLPRSRQASTRRSTDLSGLFVEPEKVHALHRWIIGFITVNFDLEVGPVVDSVYPPFWLSPSEAENIAFSSFPDSLQFDQGSETHSFRIRAAVPADDEQLTRSGAAPRPVSVDGFFYGFSHFTQEKDNKSKRGYLQRSLVILTHLPYPALFSLLVSKLGPLYRKHGNPMLEAACHNMTQWSDPRPGTSVEVGFLGSVLQVALPLSADELQPLDKAASAADVTRDDIVMRITASMPPTVPPVLNLLDASLSHLWSIWECLVLCEPILVYAPSPAMTSQAVWWLRDLLRPIPLAADFRPYFTIHDGDHAMLVNKMPPKAGLLLGVTNPFFDRECSHWPHILSLGRSPASGASNKAKAASKAAGPPPGWKTKTHKRHISKDRALLKRLEDARAGDERMRAELSSVLRQHFSSRTTALLVPLNRYLNTLLPQPSTPSSSATTLASLSRASTRSRTADPERLRPFSTSDFMTSLRTHGAALPFKSAAKQREFYERWLRTPTFGVWLARQEEVVHGVLKGK